MKRDHHRLYRVDSVRSNNVEIMSIDRSLIVVFSCQLRIFFYHYSKPDQLRDKAPPSPKGHRTRERWYRKKNARRQHGRIDGGKRIVRVEKWMDEWICWWTDDLNGYLDGWLNGLGR